MYFVVKKKNCMEINFLKKKESPVYNLNIDLKVYINAGRKEHCGIGCEEDREFLSSLFTRAETQLMLFPAVFLGSVRSKSVTGQRVGTMRQPRQSSIPASAVTKLWDLGQVSSSVVCE